MGVHRLSFTGRRYRRAALAAENAALRERNALLTRLLSQDADVAWRARLAPTPRLEYAGPGLAALIGYEPAELLARPGLLLDLADPVDAIRAAGTFAGSTEPRSFEQRLRHRDGHTVWVEIHCLPVLDDAGALVALEGVARDISARKATEEALRASETRLRNLFDYAPDGILLLGAVSEEAPPQIIDCNPSICALSGYERDELVGQALYFLDTEPYTPEQRRAAWAALKRGEELRYESVYRRKDGSALPVEVSNRLLVVSDRQVILAAVRDISERRSAEEQLRLQARLLESVGQAIIAADTAGRVIYWNPAAAAIFGYSAAEMLGRSMIEVMILDHFRPEAEKVVEQIYSGQPYASELTLTRADGQEVPAYATATLYCDPQGRPLGITAVITDMSDYKRVDAALRESEARYRHVIEMQSELVCRYNPDGCVLTFVNEAYCRTFGRTREQLLGSSFLTLIPLELRGLVAGRAADFTPERPVRLMEHLVVVADGSLRWQQWSDRAIFDAQGRVVDVICVGRDITERVLAEEELRRLNEHLERRVAARTAELSASNAELQAAVAERDASARELAAANYQLAGLNRDLAQSHNRLRTVVNSLSDALALVSWEGQVLIANQALGELLGVAPAQLLGKPWGSLALPGAALIERATVAGIVYRERVQVELHPERTAVFDLQAIPLGEPGGAIREIVLRLSDVTEQVQLEALAIANERLAAHGRLAAIVAHEISTPLQAIENLLYLAGGKDDQGDDYRPLVRDEIRRVSAILRRLLTLSQPDDGPSGSIDCTMVIDRVLLLTSTSLARRGIAVARLMPPALPLVPGDADQLTQVLLNLVVNAIDAMPDGGRLSISVELSSGRAIISVADSGVGVAPELHARIFEPFFTTKAGGSGLGLAVARRIISQHGGELRLECGPANGAQFVISLPLSQGERRE
jgi:PAS domain S-box-containing protein